MISNYFSLQLFIIFGWGNGVWKKRNLMNYKKTAMILVSSVVMLTLFTACGGQEKKSSKPASSSSSKVKKKVDLNSLDLPQLKAGVSKDEYLIKIKTTEGEIEIKLFPKQAPLAVKNFVTHAEKDYYNGTTFHRVIKNFMIQGGDPQGTGQGGESIWKDKDKKKDSGNGFKNEISNKLYNIRGALSMANAGPNTNGSQFFINQNTDDRSDGLLAEDNPKKIIEAYKQGGNPDLDGDYTVFGQVVKGMDVVDKIASAEVKTSEGGGEADSSGNSSPVNPVKIEAIEILQKPSK